MQPKSAGHYASSPGNGLLGNRTRHSFPSRYLYHDPGRPSALQVLVWCLHPQPVFSGDAFDQPQNSSACTLLVVAVVVNVHVSQPNTRMGHRTLVYATADEADAYVFYRCFFLFFAFSVRHKNTRQPFSGTAERIFMKLLLNDSGENGVCIAVPKWGLGPRLIFWGLKTTHCTLDGDAWRVTEN